MMFLIYVVADLHGSFFFVVVFTTEIQFDHDTIAGRVRELAFLNPKVSIGHVSGYLNN